jgi:uncharacterized protein (DUF302 family)
MSEYGITKKVDHGYSETIELVKQELEKHGFGVLTEIDVAQKFDEKLEVDFDEYMILGACNPEKAYKALQKEQELGLLLPCNVIVYRDNGDTYVSAAKATKMLEIAGNDKLDALAEEVEDELAEVIHGID